MTRNKSIVLLLIISTIVVLYISCTEDTKVVAENAVAVHSDTSIVVAIDTTKIPNDKFGEAVRYGRELMLNTAYYIGPEGKNGKYLGNKMNCSNCHQDAGTKAFSFNLMSSHDNYPQYRGREGKILTLAERVNNCIMHPHLGKPLPLDGKEMVAFLSYLKWINSFVPKAKPFVGSKNLQIDFPATAASSENGKVLFEQNCSRCHGANGEGQMKPDNITYLYPPLWGPKGYQSGSSMHRIIKQAQWLKHNMPYDKVTDGTIVLTDEQALDLAAYINDDEINKRPLPTEPEYPYNEEKAIDYDRGPFVDTFSVSQHKYGPYKPIIDYWKEKKMKAVY